MDVTTLVEGVLGGQRRALARLLTAVEAGEEATVRAVVAAVHPHTGRAHTVGVTGSPGVGKSTLVGQIVAEQRRRGRTVAVLAVDPSSPISGGALLGDRIRMADQVLDEGVYIRSMASRGHLGGLSWATPPALTVLEAAGFDVVLIETVGVGQAEVEVAALADSTIVALAPGMGDAIQAAKAGILEIADVYVVNKSDHEGADRTVRELRSMRHLVREAGRWDPPILRTNAGTGEGVEAVCDALDAHLEWARSSGARDRQRRRAARVQVREIVLAAVRRRLGLAQAEAEVGAEVGAPVGAGALGEGPTEGASGGASARLEAALDDVVARRSDPYAAADSLIARLGGVEP